MEVDSTELEARRASNAPHQPDRRLIDLFPHGLGHELSLAGVPRPAPAGQLSPEAVLGIVSLIFWSLIIVISIKYAILIMRADNHGEGGILALLALISPRRAKQSRRRAVMVVIGVIGATLLYGDGAITPAISVLSALEGIKVYAPQMERAVVPLTAVILVLLFMLQRNGTSWIGGIFGPIMLIWFVVIGILGLVGIAKAPGVLAALSPLPAVTYLWHAVWP
jgi:KUP system potassium uptake protein